MNFDEANTGGHVKLDNKDFFPTTKFDKYGNETALISSALRTYYKIQGFFKDFSRRWLKFKSSSNLYETYMT